MALATKTIAKPAPPIPAVEAPVSLADASLEALADQYGRLDDMVRTLKKNPVFAHFAAVQEELAKRLKAQLEPTDEATLTGEHWALEIGVAAQNPREITNIPKIAAFLGPVTFSQIAKVNLGDLDKYLTPDQLAEVVNSDTGYSDKRKITAKFLG